MSQLPAEMSLSLGSEHQELTRPANEGEDDRYDAVAVGTARLWGYQEVSPLHLAVIWLDFYDSFIRTAVRRKNVLGTSRLQRDGVNFWMPRS